MRPLLSIIICLLISATTALAQPNGNRKVNIREYRKVFTTYPFGDPNPVAVMGKIYPYYRFDQYTDTPVEKEWTVVELENDYIRVLILPEIGGKIWTAIEKSTGRPFIYNNQVVKFRDIAMRGPWTSGGIEANYGIIGHTPNTATPVDYLVRTNADGSVSCLIGVLDLLTRTPWRLEVRLAPDEAFFTTTSFWFNATPLEQAYYTWMNVGIKSAGNLQFIFPGTHAIGHGGEVSPWPIDPATGRDLSFYEKNDFGSYKSYHVFGQHTDFYGGYWHDDDFGMARYSTRDDKPGKKIWIWGLSPQGMIWEKLLTDRDGQYVEVQSGRLFNQAAEQSSRTPFKHRGFAPYAADRWTEFWFPVRGTKGMVRANDLGALNLRKEEGGWKLWFSPVRSVNEQVEVFAGDEKIYSKRLSLRPLQTFHDTLPAVPAGRELVVRIGGNRLVYRTDQREEALDRPLAMPTGFDWNSVYGLSLQGRELIRQRHFEEARQRLDAALRLDPHYAPALVDLALIEYRSMRYREARELTRRALAIDTYDPAANYYYGLASAALAKPYDARDGFEIAAQSTEFRHAASTELARLYLREGDLDRARDYGDKALEVNQQNLEAWQIRAVVARLSRQPRAAQDAQARILAIDPLNHLVRFEKSLLSASPADRLAVGRLIRNEMPHETWLEMAIWYAGLKLYRESADLLALAPDHPEIAYWRAWLSHQQQSGDADRLLAAADRLSPRLVFPFRPETAPVLEWVIGRDKEKDGPWKPRYYLALLNWSLGRPQEAGQLFAACGNRPDYAPFYASRAAFIAATGAGRAGADPLPDALNAAGRDPREWRYGKFLIEHYLNASPAQPDLARDVAQRYFEADPRNYKIGILYARTLIVTRQFSQATQLLANLKILPYEGSTEGRTLYREACLGMALKYIRDKQHLSAITALDEALRWPENLGVGKPYPEDVDERLEELLAASQFQLDRRPDIGRRLLERVATPRQSSSPAGPIFAALALQRLGRTDEAEKMAAMITSPPWREWTRQILRGQRPAAPPTDLLELRILSEWLQI
ncbi:MAG: DUF5107 domain-containing protein [Acidobacteriota bacterium]